MHQDPFAKSKRVTDASGNVVSVIELDPWGGETNRSSNEAFQPRKFTTYERDSIGSDEAMHRRYNRWWSHFEQPDPYDGSYDLTDPQSFNRYSYVQNDPVNFVDPLGLDPQDPPVLRRPDPNRPFDPNFELPIRGSERSGSFGGLEIGSMVIETGPQDPPDPAGGGGPTTQQRPAPRPRRLDPTHQECQALARKIDNILANIRRKAQEILDDKLKLPLTGSGPRRGTIEGHLQILEEDIKNLERRRQEYKDKCGGGPGGPGGVPVTPPVVTPAPQPNPGPRMSPVPTWIPRFMLIPLIITDPCLVYPHLCFKPNADLTSLLERN